MTIVKRLMIAAVPLALCCWGARAAEDAPVVTAHSVTTNGVEVRWFEEMVPMKDGTRLYTYGVLPPEGEKRGIVLVRNPYVEEKPSNMPAYAYEHRGALARGYAYVHQHVRVTVTAIDMEHGRIALSMRGVDQPQ